MPNTNFDVIISKERANSLLYKGRITKGMARAVVLPKKKTKNGQFDLFQ